MLEKPRYTTSSSTLRLFICVQTGKPGRSLKTVCPSIGLNILKNPRHKKPWLRSGALETKKNGRRIGAESKFALLNIGAVKEAAAKYCIVTIALNEEEGDPSHSLIQGYEAFNELVAEEIRKIIIAAYPPPSRT
jgi:hypothetical protein